MRHGVALEPSSIQFRRNKETTKSTEPVTQILPTDALTVTESKKLPALPGADFRFAFPSQKKDARLKDLSTPLALVCPALTLVVRGDVKYDWLSVLTENAVEELSKAGAVETTDEGALAALNLGVLSAHLYVRCHTTELFALSITAKAKRRGLLQILSSATEFEDVGVERA